MSVTVKIKKLNENAKLPAYGSEFAAGADLCACTDAPVEIPAHATVLIRTGLAAEIPVGYAGLIYARSGLASKRGLAPANKVGVIDSDYRGEIFFSAANISDEDYTVMPGERVAQMMIMPVLSANFVVCDELDDTSRGAGGFGSTGKV